MVNATASLRAGAAGLSCIQGNIYPELIVWICEHYDNPEKADDVAKLQKFFVDSMEIVHLAYPTIAKYSLSKRGFPISLYTRRDVGELTADLRERADQLLAEIDELQNDLGIESVFRKNLVAPLK